MSYAPYYQPTPSSPSAGNPYTNNPGGTAPPANTDGSGPGTANPGASAAAATTGTTYAGEDEFILGPDGKSIYQRIRDGFRTSGFKLVGTTDDLQAAATAGGTDLQVLTGEMQKQLSQVQQAKFQAAQSGYNGLSNQDLLQQNQQQGGILANQDNAWKNAASQGDPTMSNAAFERQWQGAKDVYGSAETAYDTQHQVATHNLQDLQRNLGTQQATWNLGHLAQTQAQDAFKLNQTGYEQQQATKDRDLGSGFGYAAMNAGNKLVGQ